MFPIAGAALMAFTTLKAGAQVINKKIPIGSFGYGVGYAGGTVVGYHGFSQFFKPKWKYLGSPQRVSKL